MDNHGIIPKNGDRAILRARGSTPFKCRCCVGQDGILSYAAQFCVIPGERIITLAKVGNLRKGKACSSFDHRELDFGHVTWRVLVGLMVGVVMQINLTDRACAAIAAGFDPGKDGLLGERQSGE